MNTLVFDIETVPDVELGRKLYDVMDFDDATVAKVMLVKHKHTRSSDVLPAHQQRVIAISGFMKSREGVRAEETYREHLVESERLEKELAEAQKSQAKLHDEKKLSDAEFEQAKAKLDA